MCELVRAWTARNQIGLGATHPGLWHATGNRPSLCPPGKANVSGLGPASRAIARLHGGKTAALTSPLVDATAADDRVAHTADTWLGTAFLKLLPGPSYYLVSLVLPVAVFLSAAGATHGTALLQFLTTQPAVQVFTPLSAKLAGAAASKPLATVLSVALSLTAVSYVFLAVPLLDVILGRDLRNPSPPEAIRAAHSPLYRAILHVYVVVHYAVLACAAHAVCASHIHPLSAIGVTLSTGVMGTVFFTVAHELLHGSKVDRLLANMLLASAGYMHWTESHLAHHIKVATPEDPASARRGEPLWAFLPRSVWGNLVDGYRGEAQRLAAKGAPLLSLQNRMLAWVACPLLLAAVFFRAYSWMGVGFLVSQALISIFALESVNYIEHYGLRRRKGPNGRSFSIWPQILLRIDNDNAVLGILLLLVIRPILAYERVGAQHSWTAGWMFTNAAAFRLQRHADHHMAARRPYQNLRDLPDAPQLPADYPALILCALVPPLFFAIMHPRLDQLDRSAAAAAGTPA